MKKIRLSLVVAAYNEEENIEACLSSAKDLVEEMVVVDGASQDKTVERVNQFKQELKKTRPEIEFKLIKTTNKFIFHKNKQLGLQAAEGEWILQLDADERLSKALKKEISRVLPAGGGVEDAVNGYYLPRKNYFLNRFLKKGGQYPDYVIRLVKNGQARFPCQSVHEQIKVKGELAYLENDLVHLYAPSFSRYLRNANRYTTLTARELMRKKVSLGWFNKLKYMVFLPVVTFLKLFVRHKGFQDGLPGLVFAFCSGLHHFFAFVKYWEKQTGSAEFKLDQDWD